MEKHQNFSWEQHIVPVTSQAKGRGHWRTCRMEIFIFGQGIRTSPMEKTWAISTLPDGTRSSLRTMQMSIGCGMSGRNSEGSTRILPTQTGSTQSSCSMMRMLNWYTYTDIHIHRKMIIFIYYLFISYHLSGR
jgi:hypothetical protein